tara:strand:- start:39 stop:308 length:270 start_codon:yes stop_codon:yes gene_type:complete
MVNLQDQQQVELEQQVVLMEHQQLEQVVAVAAQDRELQQVQVEQVVVDLVKKEVVRVLQTMELQIQVVVAVLPEEQALLQELALVVDLV